MSKSEPMLVLETVNDSWDFLNSWSVYSLLSYENRSSICSGRIIETYIFLISDSYSSLMFNSLFNSL